MTRKSFAIAKALAAKPGAGFDCTLSPGSPESTF
jgi:hypothetical protein